MSIKIQKILVFIPIVNFFTVCGAWIICLIRHSMSYEYIFRKNMLMMFCCILISIPLILTSRISIGWLDILTKTICGYFYLFVTSFIALKSQEEILREYKKL